jgi:hypothetical protein
LQGVIRLASRGGRSWGAETMAGWGACLPCAEGKQPPTPNWGLLLLFASEEQLESRWTGFCLCRREKPGSWESH